MPESEETLNSKTVGRSDSTELQDMAQSDRHNPRFSLIWAVMLFQVKLLADGARDLLLSPLSIGAAILGLILGGKDPARYFRRLQRWGRKTDLLINLFGQHRRGTTAEKLVEPLERRITEAYHKGGWLSRNADRLNRTLDQVNKNIDAPASSRSDPEKPRDNPQ